MTLSEAYEKKGLRNRVKGTPVFMVFLLEQQAIKEAEKREEVRKVLDELVSQGLVKMNTYDGGEGISHWEKFRARYAESKE